MSRIRSRAAVFAASIAASSLAIASPSTAASLPVVSADVKIQSMTVSSTPTPRYLETLTQIVVENDNDDDARNVQLIITLPPTSHVPTLPANATTSQPTYMDPNVPWPVIGNVVFSLGTIAVNGTVTVSLQSESLAAVGGPSTAIGAFVVGSLPDPNGANNFRSQPLLP
jgi:hypothetical protein